MQGRHLIVINICLSVMTFFSFRGYGQANDSHISTLPYQETQSITSDDLLYSLFAPANENGGFIAPHHGHDEIIGQAWGDYDNDGWLDLYVTGGAGANVLFHNQEGVLVESPLSEQVALADMESSGTVFADYDNDGWLDLYVVNDGQANVLFRNEKGENFVDVTREAGVGDMSHGRSASWGDYDKDGYLDLYVSNWSCSPNCGHPTFGDRDTLYHNQGDGTFKDVTRLLLDSKTMGAGFIASFVDFDNDGDLDIYLVNDSFVNPVGNALYRNDGEGCRAWCFTEISTETGSDTELMGMGLITGDVDNDLDVDLFFTNTGQAVFLQNQGNTFANTTQEQGLLLPNNPVSWGTVLADFNNDGWRDIYLAITEILPARNSDDAFFLNAGDGTFSIVESEFTHTGQTLGVAYADYDRDGWVDIVVGNSEDGYTLYHNQGAKLSDNNRTTIILQGAQIVGARVILETDDLTQMQDIQIGSSLGAGNATELYFGLGQAEQFNIKITWADGTEQQFSDLAANQIYIIEYAN